MTYQEQRLQEAYQKKQEEIQMKINTLKLYLNSHEEEQNKDWGHQGDLNHISNELDKLIDFMKS